jgi:hypothetical protein
MKRSSRAALLVLGTAGALLGSPPAFSQPTFFFEGDMVRGEPQPGVKAPVCVLASQFKRGDQVVWRIRVLDPATGQGLDDKALKSVQVQLADGQTLNARYGGHPPKGKPSDYFWSVSWKIPADYPTGSLSYTVKAVGQDERSASWAPFKMAPSQLTVTP